MSGLPRYRILSDTSPEGLQKQINDLNNYKAINVSGFPASNIYYLVALMEYEKAQK